MVTNYLRVILIIGLAFLMQGCPFANLPCEGVDENRYIISNPGLITVYPEHTTFEVGDTIWIESTISTIQITNTGQQVDIYQELNLPSLFLEMTLLENLPNDTIGGTIHYNDVPYVTQTIDDKGKSEIRNTNNEQVVDLYYSYETTYMLDIGFILNDRGKFYFNNEISNRIRVIASKGNGCGETYSIYTTLANPNNGYAYEFEVID